MITSDHKHGPDPGYDGHSFLKTSIQANQCLSGELSAVDIESVEIYNGTVMLFVEQNRCLRCFGQV